jgi:hypothetical protein
MVTWESVALTPPAAQVTNTSDIFLYPVSPSPVAWTNKAAVAGNQPAATGSGFPATPPFTHPVLGVDPLTGPGEYIYVPAGCVVTAVIRIGNNYTLQNSIDVDVLCDEWVSPGVEKKFRFSNYLAGTVLTIASSTTGAMFQNTIAASNMWIRPNTLQVKTVLGDITPQFLMVDFVVSSASILTYVSSSITAGTVASTWAAKSKVHLPIATPVEFLNSPLPWASTRVTASAMLGTNVSQVLKKGGTILGGRLSPNVQNAWNVASTYVANLHPAEKAFLALETGFYTYAPPTTDLVFFSDYTMSQAKGPTSTVGPPAECPVFRLDNDAFYNKLYVTASSDAEQLALNITWHLEFRTSSSLFQVALSQMPLEALHTAQLVLAEAGFFFENPTHDTVLTKVIDGVKRYGPYALGVVSPLAGRLMNAVIKGPRVKHKGPVVPRKGPTKVPATTAGKSGITQGKQNRQQKKKMKGGLQMYLDSKKKG